MKLPDDDVLRYIEEKRGVEISRDSFVSSEFYNPHHPEGKLFPAYYANNGKGDGTMTKLVELEGKCYVVQPCGKPIQDIIPILKSSRRPKE